jgi:hypothetical protein
LSGKSPTRPFDSEPSATSEVGSLRRRYSAARSLDHHSWVLANIASLGTSSIDCPLCTWCMLPGTISSPGQTSRSHGLLVLLGLRFSNLWGSDVDKVKRTLPLAHYQASRGFRCPDLRSTSILPGEPALVFTWLALILTMATVFHLSQSVFVNTPVNLESVFTQNDSTCLQTNWRIQCPQRPNAPPCRAAL